MSATQAQAADARANERAAARRASDDMTTATMRRLTTRIAELMLYPTGPGTSPALRCSPILEWAGDSFGWTAIGQCKPRGRRYRLIRGSGRTIAAALADLDRQLTRFERGERDGEQ